MRRIVVAMMMAMTAASAQAADLPDLTDLPILRGGFRDGLSTGTRNWRGFYVGGQAGYAAANVDFGRATSSMTDFMLRNAVLQSELHDWTLLGKNDIQTTGFGGFVGRNWQWDDAVLGLEVSYSHMSGFETSSANVLARRITNPIGSSPPPNHTYFYDTTLAGGAAVKVHDVMTFRARAGWAAGIFMPYAFGGLAVGRIDSSRFATITGTRTDRFEDTSTTPATVTETTVGLAPLGLVESRTNNFVAGYTLGLGTEMALFGNLFARAEWEYVKFLKVKDISIGMNTVRAGLGYRF